MLSFMYGAIRPVARISLCNRNPKLSNLQIRFNSNNNADEASKKLKNRSTLYYATAAVVSFVGLTYAAVPMYRMFCQVNSYQVNGFSVTKRFPGLQLWWYDSHRPRWRES